MDNNKNLQENKFEKSIDEVNDSNVKRHNVFRDKKVFIFIICIIIIVVLLIFLIFNKPIRMLFVKINFNDYIKNELLSECNYESFELQGDNFNKLVIKYDNYKNLNFDDKINYIDKYELKSKYIDIKADIRNILKKNISDDIQIVVLSDNVKYVIDNESLIIDGKNYTKEDNYIDLIKSRLPSNVSYDEREKIIKYLRSGKIKNNVYAKILENSDENLINEIKYQYANILYSDGDDIEALNIYKEIVDYSNAKVLINKISELHKFDGEWQGTINSNSSILRTTHRWIIKGNLCYNIFSTLTSKNSNEKYYCYIDNNVLYVFHNEKNYNNKSNPDFVMTYDGNNLCYDVGVNKMVLIKHSNNTTLPKTEYIREPSIGMTADEVRKSTWGSPKKVNKDTYSWGTTEQWVYSNNRYIYFRNGKVSSISE